MNEEKEQKIPAVPKSWVLSEFSRIQETKIWKRHTVPQDGGLYSEPMGSKLNEQTYLVAKMVLDGHQEQAHVGREFLILRKLKEGLPEESRLVPEVADLRIVDDDGRTIGYFMEKLYSIPSWTVPGLWERAAELFEAIHNCDPYSLALRNLSRDHFMLNVLGEMKICSLNRAVLKDNKDDAPLFWGFGREYQPLCRDRTFAQAYEDDVKDWTDILRKFLAERGIQEPGPSSGNT